MNDSDGGAERHYRVTVASWKVCGVLIIASAGLVVVGFTSGVRTLWVAGAALTITALALVWRIDVSKGSLTARPLTVVPGLRVDGEDVVEASPIDVRSVMKYGGLGRRWRPGASAVMLGRGPALEFVRKNGTRVVVTMPNPEVALRYFRGDAP